MSLPRYKEIRLEKLTKKYHNKVIFSNLDGIFKSNKYNFIIGKNGSGKSTILKCILSLVKYEGKIIGIDELTISYIPEKIYLPDYVTVYDFLFLLWQNDGESKEISIETINEYLVAFNLLNYQDKFIKELSLGTKQKIILIQGLIKKADVYLFDEPLNGLDEKTQKVFFLYLRKLKKMNKLIIIVSHRPQTYPLRTKCLFSLEENYG